MTSYAIPIFIAAPVLLQYISFLRYAALLSLNTLSISDIPHNNARTKVMSIKKMSKIHFLANPKNNAIQYTYWAEIMYT